MKTNKEERLNQRKVGESVKEENKLIEKIKSRVINPPISVFFFKEATQSKTIS